MLCKNIIFFFLSFLFITSSLQGEANDCQEKPSLEENNCKDSNVSSKEVQEEQKNKKETPPKIGNFALPSSQQPSVLFGFGGNVIDAGEVQLSLFADDFVGPKRTVIDIFPSILFGITDNLSISFNAPFTPEFRDGGDRSHGLEDFFMQLEYAFYNKSNRCYVDQATMVVTVTTPTGSINKLHLRDLVHPHSF